MNHVGEKGKWNVRTTIEKFFNQESLLAERPDDVLVVEGNALLSEGINTLWTLVCGGVATAFSNATAHIGVGDGDTAVDKTQTGLQGTNKIYKPMDTGYPQFGSNDKVVFKSTFGPDDANFVWKEWSVANGDGTSNDTTTVINLNRKVEPMGEKYAGSTWVITVEISLS